MAQDAAIYVEIFNMTSETLPLDVARTLVDPRAHPLQYELREST
ncbi:MAG: hypothetical protein QOG17_1546 [Gammaproteobacteria bacterium]|jgi:hypothetical protein|nr:hypothetical protein [Gammaproteobacteria bacterium]